MEWFALAVFALYGLTAFGIRTLLQVRRTGDSGFRGLTGRPGSPEWWVGVLFVVALAAGIAAPAAGLLGFPALPLLAGPWSGTLGTVLALLGILGTFLTQLAMGESWRIGVDEDEHTPLVTAGPFRAVRNPIFTAMVATGAGIALMVPNLIAVTGWLLLLLAIELQVRVVEEPYLRRHHGEPYDHYLATVGRFVPGVGRKPLPDSSVDLPTPR